MQASRSCVTGARNALALFVLMGMYTEVPEGTEKAVIYGACEVAWKLLCFAYQGHIVLLAYLYLWVCAMGYLSAVMY